MDRLSTKRLGLSFGILSALLMLILGVLGNFGIYNGAVEMMISVHYFFNLSFLGIVAGMIEAFVVAGFAGIGIAYFYNITGGEK